MSIEKFNPRILGESVPFTQVSTKVIQEITNLEAGFVWVYLLTLPPDWQVVKVHLKNHFGIGELKLKRIFAYLNEHKLIEYTRQRLSNGQLGAVDVRILNGTRFKNPVVQTTGIENHPVVNHTYGFQATTKEINNKLNTNNKRNISCSSGDERASELSLFDYFWSIYPRKQKKIDARKIWERKKYDKIATIICKNIQVRIYNEWKGTDKKFIPLPSSYLNGERWKDEIIISSPPKEHPVNAVMREIKEELNKSNAKNFLLN